MKNYFIAVALMAGSFCFAQEQEYETFESQIPVGKTHELRIDVLEGLAVPTLELNYEYIISKYSGAGAAISINLSGDDIFEGQDFAFTPYYRQYFFNKKDFGARGFFVEGNLQVATGENYSYLYDADSNTDSFEEEKWFAAGLGVIIGQKWVSNNGFVLELSIGGGRYFIEDDFSPGGYVRGGILVGYRW